MKTGTNSMYELLRQHYSGEKVGVKFHCRDTKFIQPEWYVFKTARNPFTRAVSIWSSTCFRDGGKDDRYGFRYMCKSNGFNPDDFAQFMTCAVKVLSGELSQPNKFHRGLLVTQTEWLRRMNITFDAVVHTETMCRDFNQLPFVKKPIAKKYFPKSNQSQKQDYRKYYTRKVFELVQQWGAEDFKQRGYDSTKLP